MGVWKLRILRIVISMFRTVRQRALCGSEGERD
jgi:hypothetical protein